MSRILNIGNEISEQEVTNVLDIIKSAFDEGWLIDAAGQTPLQILWKRPDVFATQELYNFGTSLQKMASVNKTWVDGQIIQAKSNHKNNQRGAIFEIFSLGFLHHPPQTVDPASNSNPGFDGIVHLSPAKKIRLSLKSYGMSSHEMEFNRFASEFEQEFVKEIQKRGIHSIQLFIDAYELLPSPEKWKELKGMIPEILNRYKFGELVKFTVKDYWSVMMLNINDNKQYSKKHASYLLMITSEIHKNEYQNVYDKLDDACNNLVKHHGTEDHSICNTVMVHMPPNVSIERCKFYVEQFFAERPDKAISLVMLYQPSIVSNTTYTSKHINHCIQMVSPAGKFEAFLNGTEIHPQIGIPIGVLTDTPAATYMVPTTGGKPFPVHERYLYQRAHFYVEVPVNLEGSTEGNIKKLAPGIFEHPVLEIPGQGELIFGLRQPPDDALLIN
jgi:hypothetical protein